MLLRNGFFIVATTACVALSQARAEILVNNGSFESPTPSGNYSTALPTDWSFSTGKTESLIIYPSAGFSYYGTAAPNGAAIFGLESQYGSAGGGIQQNIGTMSSGEKYTFHATLISNSDGWRCG